MGPALARAGGAGRALRAAQSSAATRASPLVAILSLALGIGANTALFEVVNAVRLRTLPVADPARLVEVHIVDIGRGARQLRDLVPLGHAADLARDPGAPRAFRRTVRVGPTADSACRTAARRAPAEGLWVSGEFFDTLGLTPAAGRLLSPDDDRPGCAPRAVLGHGLWRRAYGGDPSAVGRTITLDSKPVEIVGVAPAAFHGLEVGRGFDVALPLCAEPAFSSDGKGRVDAGTTWWLSVFGRLKPGWTLGARVGAAGRGLAGGVPRLAAGRLPAGQRRALPELQARGLSRPAPDCPSCARPTHRRCGCCSPSPASFS